MALTKVGKGGLDKGSIKNQTNLGAEAADTDEYLVYDSSADGLKAITSANVVGAGMITGKDEITIGNVSGDDVLLIYDTSAGVLKKITKSAFDALQPGFTSVSPSNLLTGDGTGNYTIVVTGTDFDTTATFKLVTDGGTDIALDTVTRDSSTQLTGVVAKNKTNLTNANEPFDIVITNGNGLSTTSANAVTIDAQPIWSTASGNIGSIYDSGRSGFSITVAAADPESGGDITYTLESGSLPAGLSGTSTSSGYVVSGTASAVGSNTTSTFTIRAADANSNIADRQFNIVVYAPTQQSFTSSGTFSVPSGISSVNVLVVAGGGGAGSTHSGGGGAGGLIYRPGFTVTPGGTVTVTVGDGGASSTSATGHSNGQNSVFGTLTAVGGGKSGTNQTPGSNGGSGGGCGYGQSQGGTANQPTQSGDSGTYGFGNPGGGPGANSPSYGTGGGGGAGAAGSSGNNGAGGPSDHPIGGPGGVGKAYTIADGTTSVYYAGGGGGASGNGDGSGSTSQGGQGGGGGGVTSGVGQSGTANRGGGGGGSDDRSAPNGGGTGGKGIVIVSY